SLYPALRSQSCHPEERRDEGSRRWGSARLQRRDPSTSAPAGPSLRMTEKKMCATLPPSPGRCGFGADGAEEQFGGGLAQVVVRAHHAAVGAGGGDEEHVAAFGLGQAATVAEHVARLADGPHD